MPAPSIPDAQVEPGAEALERQFVGAWANRQEAADVAAVVLKATVRPLLDALRTEHRQLVGFGIFGRQGRDAAWASHQRSRADVPCDTCDLLADWTQPENRT